MTKQDNTVIKSLDKLQQTFSMGSQLQLVRQIAEHGEKGQEALLELLINRRVINEDNMSSLDGILFEVLNSTNIDKIKEEIRKYFNNGLIDLASSSMTNYQPLQELLINQKFQEADQLTQIYLCRLAGLNEDSKRKWLYFTDIYFLPCEELLVLDLLWRVYSRGKFGFSVQRQLWLSNNCDWEKLWEVIEWKSHGISYRYPSEFTWNITAPYGHLPLFNQLRGVQTLSALFDHVVWSQQQFELTL